MDLLCYNGNIMEVKFKANTVSELLYLWKKSMEEGEGEGDFTLTREILINAGFKNVVEKIGGKMDCSFGGYIFKGVFLKSVNTICVDSYEKEQLNL